MERNVMKKTFILIVGAMLLFGMLSVPVNMSKKDQTNFLFRNNATPLTLYEDELDQNQSEQTDGLAMPVGRFTFLDHNYSIQVAQSFIPTKELLTRVELFMGKNATTTYPLVVAIRDNLTHTNLVETSVATDHFITGNYSWVEFNFSDLWVNTGQTYYIVSYTQNATNNTYAWAANNNSDAYSNGCAWVSFDGFKWNKSSSQGSDLSQQNNKRYHQGPVSLSAGNGTGDMCFRTYGIEETTLQIIITPNILAPVISINNSGNETAWNVEWEVMMTGNGLLRTFNISMNGTKPELAPGDAILIKLGTIFEFGKIKITAKARALNAEEVTVTKDGFLFFIFYFFK